ncbi:Retroelement [Phytophthora megakarya]|uniref:Retroelement n=1 Tax=Phytophthora megakarya TaxID=4795 RepID=A0A225VV55_9STRA|nr:Retroelement [Phytophthora megakarya]
MRQYIWWPGMREHIAQYIATCEACVRHKSGSRRRKGLLQSLPVPEHCWQHVTMDFVTALPLSNGFDAVYVIVCRLSNRPCYIPTTKVVNAKTTARLFFDLVVRYYLLPESTVSDRDPKFTSEFWQELMAIMLVKQRMTVSRRAQAYGRSERQIRTLEDSLRCVVSHHGDNWAKMLPTVEYAHATLVSTSTRISPFEVDCDGNRDLQSSWQRQEIWLKTWHFLVRKLSSLLNVTRD